MLRRFYFFLPRGNELYLCWNTFISMEYRTSQDFMKMKTSQTQAFFSSFGFFLPEMMPSEADFAPARVTQLRSRRKRICLVMRGLSSGMSIISPLLWWFVYQRIYLVGCKQVKNKDGLPPIKTSPSTMRENTRYNAYHISTRVLVTHQTYQHAAAAAEVRVYRTFAATINTICGDVILPASLWSQTRKAFRIMLF